MSKVIDLFWKTKGIENADVLSMEEKRAFIEELQAFKSGYNRGFKEGKREAKSEWSQRLRDANSE